MKNILLVISVLAAGVLGFLYLAAVGLVGSAGDQFVFGEDSNTSIASPTLPGDDAMATTQTTLETPIEDGTTTTVEDPPPKGEETTTTTEKTPTFRLREDSEVRMVRKNDDDAICTIQLNVSNTGPDRAENVRVVVNAETTVTGEPEANNVSLDGPTSIDPDRVSLYEKELTYPVRNDVPYSVDVTIEANGNIEVQSSTSSVYCPGDYNPNPDIDLYLAGGPELRRGNVLPEPSCSIVVSVGNRGQDDAKDVVVRGWMTTSVSGIEYISEPGIVLTGNSSIQAGQDDSYGIRVGLVVRSDVPYFLGISVEVDGVEQFRTSTAGQLASYCA